MLSDQDLKRALNSIDNAKRLLKDISYIDEAYWGAKKAIRELEDAESKIKK